MSSAICSLICASSNDTPGFLGVFFLIGLLENATTTHPLGDRELREVSWMPDGQSLLVSTAADKEAPIRIMKTDLTGKLLETYQIGEKQTANAETYFEQFQADGITVSPDGRYAAFFVRPNSASIAADGVGIYLLDMQQPARAEAVSGGLGYPEWFAWSPDSSKLAVIKGRGREATDNKSLAVVTASDFKVIEAGLTGFVDSWPVWSNPDAGKLYFTRGKGSTAWLGKYNPEEVMVPGQRIWERGSDGKEQPVTQGSAKTADYYPAVSPDGRQLLFVRMDGAEHGSLYVTSAGSRQETELLRHLAGDSGFYGNYLPKWIAVYWQKETKMTG